VLASRLPRLRCRRGCRRPSAAHEVRGSTADSYLGLHEPAPPGGCGVVAAVLARNVEFPMSAGTSAGVRSRSRSRSAGRARTHCGEARADRPDGGIGRRHSCKRIRPLSACAMSTPSGTPGIPRSWIQARDERNLILLGPRAPAWKFANNLPSRWPNCTFSNAVSASGGIATKCDAVITPRGSEGWQKRSRALSAAVWQDHDRGTERSEVHS